MRAVLLLVALLVPGLAQAQQAGDQFQLSRISDAEWRDTRGSSGSSHDGDALIEKVIAVTPAGVELEYSAPPGEQSNDWMLPVRVLRPPSGPLQLRNRAELESRIDKWLKDGQLQRSACGKWIFTWNAFRIECDPEAALRGIEGFSIGPARTGAPFSDPNAQRAVPLVARPDGKGFTAVLVIDPEAVRKSLAEADQVVAEINGKPIALKAAREAHAADQISGTIKVTIDTDATGQARRQTRVTTLTTTRDGRTETRTTTEVLERRPIQQRVDPNSI